VGCAAGTVVGGSNKVVNGDFSILAGPGPGIAPAAGFASELPNVGTDAYPADNFGPYYPVVKGGLSIISTAVFTVANHSLVYGYRFPGDPVRDVPALDHYLYTKPHSNVYGDGYALLWRQQASLTVGTTYNFFAYFNNMLTPSIGDNNFLKPQIQLLVDGTPAGATIPLPTAPDAWVPVQFSFILSGVTGAQSTVVLEIRDYAGVRSVPAGDDFAMTGVNLKQCVSGLGVAFTSLMAIDNGNGTYDLPFVVTAKNYGVDALPLSNLQLIADLSLIANSVATFQIISLSSASLNVNSAFNGRTDTRLLSSAPNSLASGATAQITFTARVKPRAGSNNTGPFNIQISASAQAGTEASGSGGQTPIIIEDISTPGFDPNPGGIGVKDPVQDVPTPVYVVPLKVYLPLIQR
jgi:hypothetical protein